jgi:hypothetical protein
MQRRREADRSENAKRQRLESVGCCARSMVFARQVDNYTFFLPSGLRELFFRLPMLCVAALSRTCRCYCWMSVGARVEMANMQMADVFVQGNSTGSEVGGFDVEGVVCHDAMRPPWGGL